MRSAVLLLSLVWLSAVWLCPAVVLGQTYSPLASPLTSSSGCAAPSTFVQLGDDNYADFPNSQYYGLQPGQVYMSAFPNSIWGAQVTQLSLALGDNSGAAGPVHLRMGIYAMGGSGVSLTASLLGQTDEVTVYPSGAQTLYANLLTPVQMLGGNQYSLAVWADAALQAGSGGSNASYIGYGNVFELYVDYSLPNSMQVANTEPNFNYQTALAARGCLNPNGPVTPGTALYFFTAYAEQYAAARSSSDYTQVSTTTLTLACGVLAASTTSTTTAFGSGMQISSLTGTLSTSTSGGDGQYDPWFASSSAAVTLQSSTKLAGVTPSNLVYPSGAAALVDANGLSLRTSTGVQYVVQWNSGLQQYVFINSTANGALPAASQPIVLSGFTLSPATGRPSEACQPSPAYKAPQVPSCPANSVAISIGDSSTDLVDLFDLQYGYSSSLYGNVLYFRPFVVAVASTQLTSLSTYIFANPFIVLHLRLGVYSLVGSMSSPTWSLVGQTAELVLPNPAGGLITALLPSPVTLAVGTYAIGVWFDQPVSAPSVFWYTAGVFNLYQSYTSLSATGSLPSLATPAFDYYIASSGATACVPGATSLVVYSFCASFAIDAYGDSDVYSGTLSVHPVAQSNSIGRYYVVLGGSATLSSAYWGELAVSVGSIVNPTPIRLYDTSSSTGATALDANGLQLYFNIFNEEPLGVFLQAQPIPYTPAFNYVEIWQSPYSPAYRNSVGPGQFSFQAYTSGPLPTCEFGGTSFANLVSPASAAVESCPTAGQLPISYGDPIIADFANQKEGNSVAANTLYTNSFTALAGTTVTQLAVGVLANTNAAVSIKLGLWSSSGALVASSTPISLVQVYDQQVVYQLASPVALTAGKYYVGVVANASLNMATSTSNSVSASSAFGAGLPSTLSLSGSAAAVPVLAYGCATATHSLCAAVQYYSPSALSSTAALYQGLLLATTNADGSLTPQVASVHGSLMQRGAGAPNEQLLGYSLLSLASTPSSLYPSAAQQLTATGLQLYSSSLSTAVTLSYSSSLRQYVDSWGMSAAATDASVLNSNFSVSAIGSSGNLVPACSVLYLPSYQSPPSPSAPSCPSGQSAVVLGDDSNSDFGASIEEATYSSADFLFSQTVTTSASALSITQLAVTLNNNFNTAAHLMLAIYDFTSLQLLGNTSQVLLVNPQDGAVVIALSSPVILQPAHQYLLVMFSDFALYSSFSYGGGGHCAPVAYGAWPATFPSSSSCGPVPVAALGCTTSATATPTTSSSSSSFSSSDVNLSKGAVAGIVIGCVIGTNLMLLLCLMLVCGLGTNKRHADAGKGFTTQSREDPPSRVEMVHSESSRNVGV